jgi:ribose transport system substrate-binding protein
MKWRGLILFCMAWIGLGNCQRALSPVQTADAAERPAPEKRPDRPLKLALVTSNSSVFWKIVLHGLEKYEDETKVHIDFKMPKGGLVAEQNQILEELLKQGYDAVAVTVISPGEQLPVLQKLAKGTKLITFDSDAADSGRLIYVGTDQFDAGKKLGERIVKLLPNGGKMAVFLGSLAADNAAQRLKGIEAAIKDHKIEIVEKREDGTDRAKARKNVEDVLSANADIDLLCGVWSYNGPAIAASLEASGKKGKVLGVCFDDEDGALKAIENGTLDSTLVQSPFQMGYLSAKWLDRLAADFEHARREIPESGFIDTGTELIDKSNVSEFRKQSAQWLK